MFNYPPKNATCVICGRSSSLISKTMGICGDCIKNRPEETLGRVKKVHAETRRMFGLVPEPPRDTTGVRCILCANECSIPEGMLGYCGLRKNVNGKLVHLAGTPDKGIVQCYFDPLPTNCVAIEFCAGGSGAGYPRYAHSKGAEYGYKNLAVFYGACSFNCLSCQNWHYREHTRALSPTMSAKELAGHVDDRTSCVCFFGGDPSPQMPHALAASRIALEKAGGILRICWESNGSMAPNLMREAAALSFESGGTIKFDLKAWDENLHYALCGVSNKQTLRNFKWLAEYGKKRQVPPLLTASTLLIPGYVGFEEVESIAEFIASIDPNVPYSLLAFYPHFYMSDLPTTSKNEAIKCADVAMKHLKRVRIGNIHLLS